MFYHVRITPKGAQRSHQDALAIDKDAAWIEEHITLPRRQGHDIFVDGRVFSWPDVEQIHITETDRTVDQLIPQMNARLTASGLITATPTKWYVVTDARDVTEQFIAGPPGADPNTSADKATTFAADRKAVMVIYGHDTSANNALFAWLRTIGLEPREWTHLVQATGSASPYIGKVLNKALQDVQAVIAFFTPDEYVTAAGSQVDSTGWFQARPNVLVEAGMALITHPTRTVIVTLGTQELPSDLSGRHYVRLSSTAVEPLNDLAGRLRAAGCDTDTTGTAWLDPSGFPDRSAPVPHDAHPVVPPPERRRDRLSRGDSLGVNESLYSPDGHTKFILQEDANMVVFVDGLGNITDTGTANLGTPQCLKLEDDGRLVLYDVDGRELWSKGPRGVRLNVQDNSHVVLYPSVGDEAIWATDTFIKAGQLVQWIPLEERLRY